MEKTSTREVLLMHGFSLFAAGLRRLSASPVEGDEGAREEVYGYMCADAEGGASQTVFRPTIWPVWI